MRRDDGSATILTCELAELVQVILDAYTASTPQPDGTPDPRTAARRNHDGLIAAFRAFLHTSAVPDTAGCRSTVVFHADADGSPATHRTSSPTRHPKPVIMHGCMP